MREEKKVRRSGHQRSGREGEHRPRRRLRSTWLTMERSGIGVRIASKEEENRILTVVPSRNQECR